MLSNCRYLVKLWKSICLCETLPIPSSTRHRKISGYHLISSSEPRKHNCKLLDATWGFRSSSVGAINTNTRSNDRRLLLQPLWIQHGNVCVAWMGLFSATFELSSWNGNGGRQIGIRGRHLAPHYPPTCIETLCPPPIPVISQPLQKAKIKIECQSWESTMVRAFVPSVQWLGTLVTGEVRTIKDDLHRSF